MNKKLRFDVFKRDRFTCQYCGRKPPEVVLEADHVFPKSKGGKDEIINLVTSCFDCNRGKGAGELKDVTRVDVAKINKELKEKRLQLKEYHLYLEGEQAQLEEDLQYITDFHDSISDFGLTMQEKMSYKQFLRKFDRYKICEAIEIAIAKNTANPCTYSFGILYNWSRNNG